jgi:hypothetical protein
MERPIAGRQLSEHNSISGVACPIVHTQIPEMPATKGEPATGQAGLMES